MNISAGTSGFVGKYSFSPHAASKIESRGGIDVPTPAVIFCCSSFLIENLWNHLTIISAAEQSST